MELTADQMGHVRAICGRGLLDGHPLAIRLAASVASKQPLSELASPSVDFGQVSSALEATLVAINSSGLMR